VAVARSESEFTAGLSEALRPGFGGRKIRRAVVDRGWCCVGASVVERGRGGWVAVAVWARAHEEFDSGKGRRERHGGRTPRAAPRAPGTARRTERVGARHRRYVRTSTQSIEGFAVTSCAHRQCRRGVAPNDVESLFFGHIRHPGPRPTATVCGPAAGRGIRPGGVPPSWATRPAHGCGGPCRAATLGIVLLTCGAARATLPERGAVRDQKGVKCTSWRCQ